MEIAKNKTLVVVQTKGGVGKTVLSSHVLPALIDNKKINVFEIDDNNVSKIKSNVINFKTIKVQHSDNELYDVYFDLINDDDVVNIVDCGGGNDSIAILDKLAENDMSGLTYFVPINDDIEQFENAKNTITAIRQRDARAKINLILNRVNVMNEESIKKQFINVFGDEEVGLNNRIKELDAEHVYFVPTSTVFGIVKNIYQTTVKDSYLEARDIIDNIEELRTEWAKDRETFKTKMNKYKFAKRIDELVDSFSPLKKAIYI